MTYKTEPSVAPRKVYSVKYTCYTLAKCMTRDTAEKCMDELKNEPERIYEHMKLFHPSLMEMISPSETTELCNVNNLYVTEEWIN